MKIIFFSDIHGSKDAAETIINYYERLNPDIVVLLGDLLYHGPRNPIPDGYHPAMVAEKLNSISSRIVAVRGNCDSEVDQMLLDFSITNESALIVNEGKRLYLSHGHINRPDNLPKGAVGHIFAFGHIHLPIAERDPAGTVIINPGSTTLPKEGHPPSYAIWSDKKITVCDFNDNQICAVEIE